MNPAQETNLLAEIVVMRELIKYLIAHVPEDATASADLDAAIKRVVEAAPPLTQERVALQRAVNLIAPLAIPRRSASASPSAQPEITDGA